MADAANNRRRGRPPGGRPRPFLPADEVAGSTWPVEPTRQEVRVVVGLGNAESRYARTRHNVGAVAVARAAERLGLRPQPGATPVAGGRGGLVLPSGYMNESGRAVRRAVERWRPAPQGLLVVHDDLELPTGVVLEKLGGGHGGHNGLRDVIAALGSGAFRRLRIGIGRPPGRLDPADYVLAPFQAAEREAIEAAIDRASDLVVAFFQELGGLAGAT